MVTRRPRRKVPRSVCWTIGDPSTPGRLVTHVRVPLSSWRWPLPAPMPASWVARLTFATTALAVAALVAVSVTTRFVVLGVAAAGAATWLVGGIASALARSRLRREAWSVLTVLDEVGRPGDPWADPSGSEPSDVAPVGLEDDELWSFLTGASRPETSDD